MTETDPLQVLDGNRVRWRGRTLIHFSGCDYFRLSRHPRILLAAADGLRKSGLNVAASRLTTGNDPIHDELENALAKFFAAPTTVLLSSGYATGTVVAQALAGQFSHVLLDERAHPALQDAALHCDCPVLVFNHRSTSAVERAVSRCGPHARLLLMTDGMFAQDGAVAPLKQYLTVLGSDAMLLVDDAHGAGVLGASGRGTPQQQGVSRRRLIQCVTLSKAFGAYGGAVLCTRELRQRIWERSRAFAGSTALPPALAHAALASLKTLQRDHSLRERIQSNTVRVKDALRGMGFEVPDHPGPIAMIQTTGQATDRLRRQLLNAGIYPPLLNYPGAIQGTFRFAISSDHTDEQLDQLIACLTRFKGGGRSVAGRGTGRTRAGSPNPPGTPLGRRHRRPRGR